MEGIASNCDEEVTMSVGLDNMGALLRRNKVAGRARRNMGAMIMWDAGEW